MLDSDKTAFAEIMAGLAITFSADANRVLLQSYWAALQDLELADVRRAAGRALRELKFFPKPVELRELSGALSLDDRAAVAWGAFAKAAACVGAYSSVAFDDPLIHATVRNLGGWQALCAKPKEDFDVWVRKDFERTYAALAAAGVTAEQSAPLAGSHELHNGARGFACEAPARIAAGSAGAMKQLDRPQIKFLTRGDDR